MRALLTLAAAALAALLLFYAASVTRQAPSNEGPYSLDDIEIADDPAERARGLSGRTGLTDSYGMLFLFPEADRHGFWMKDMLVPIDIVWLDAEGVIVGIEESVSPDTYPEAFLPPSPVMQVLEVRAGLSREKGWAAGTRLSLPIP